MADYSLKGSDTIILTPNSVSSEVIISTESENVVKGIVPNTGGTSAPDNNTAYMQLFNAFIGSGTEDPNTSNIDKRCRIYIRYDVSEE